MTKISGDWPGRTGFQNIDFLTQYFKRQQEEFTTLRRFALGYAEVATGVAKVSIEQQLKKLNSDLDGANHALVALGKLRILLVQKKANLEATMAKSQPGSGAHNTAKLALIRIGEPT